MRLIGQNIAAERGEEILFSGFDFALAPGELMTIIGRNGVGKSTLLRIIAGLLAPLSGTIYMETQGQFYPPALLSHYLSAQNAMKAGLSVLDNLRFWASYLGEKTMPPEQALDRVGLAKILHLPFRVLSTGQKRRAALARLLVSERPLWLLDEPTSGLDREATALVAELMGEHLHRGGMVVAATHLPLGLEAHQHFDIGDFVFSAKDSL